METVLNFENFNWLAVIVAAVAAFSAGAFWYGPSLFAKEWMKENGLKKKDIEGGDQTKTMGVSLGLIFLESLMAALLVQALNISALGDGLLFGALLGLLFGATNTGLNYLYQMKTAKLFAIDAGYTLLRFMLYGAILAVWQ